MEAATRSWFTFREYVDLEEFSTVKHEFLDGQVWAMAGGTPEHAAIIANVIASLSTQLRGRRCRVFSSDLRIRIPTTGLGTYPDVSVVCGQIEIDRDDPKGHTIVNPTVVVEVLSPSTEAYDRGEKLDHYRRLVAVQEIVLVAHDARRIEVWRRAGGDWDHPIVEREGAAELRSIDCELPIADVYRDPLGP
jgi:Uma2 family endonuclease